MTSVDHIQLPAYLDSPVKVSGFNKSGTTLLLALLDGHPQLAVVPEELHYCRNVLFAHDRLNAAKSETGFRMFLSDEYVKDWSKGKSWYEGGYPEFDSDAFAKAIDEDCSPVSSFRDLLIRMVHAFAKADKLDEDSLVAWASKTTQNELYFPLIDRMFGGKARYIYVVRDPRDVFTSLQKRTEIVSGSCENQLGNVRQFAVQWGTQVSKIRKLAGSMSNLMILRYEDLLVDPDAVMAKVARHVGIEFHECLLKPTRHGNAWGGNSVYADGFKGMSTEPIGRYKKKLGGEQIGMLDLYLKKELGWLGYEPNGLDGEQTHVNAGSVKPVYLRDRLLYTSRYHIKQALTLMRYMYTKG